MTVAYANQHTIVSTARYFACNSAAILSKYATHWAISGSELSQWYSYSMENTALMPWR